MLRIIVIFIFFLFLLSTCEAQRILSLDKGGRVKRIHFYVRDEISVKRNNSNKWFKGKIGFIGDSVINIADTLIYISDIKTIKFRRHNSGVGLLIQASILFPAAGVSLLGISAINSAINNTYPVYSPGLLITAGALIASGPIAYRLTYHQYKINKHHPLKVMDITVN